MQKGDNFGFEHSLMDGCMLCHDDLSFSIVSPPQFPSCLDQANEIQNGIQDVLDPFYDLQFGSCLDGCMLCHDDSSFSIVSPSQFPSYVDQANGIQDVLDPFYDLQFRSCLDQADEIQNGIQAILQPKKKNELPSFKLLKKYGNGFNRLSSERIIEPYNDTASIEMPGHKLSTEELVRMAGKRLIQSYTTRVDVASILDNPSGLSSLCSLSGEEAKKVELAEFLLAAAEKVGNQQFDCAGRLLNFCDSSSSNTGNSVQRVVYYFSEALRRRIDRETGKIKANGKSQSSAIDNLLVNPNSVIRACFQGIPFYQAAHLTAVQSIIENVAEAKRVHVIDLKIRNGLQWTALMQALASRINSPLEFLKITAVVTTSKQLIERTGNRLMSFAQAMNIPFSFKIVMVSDLLDLKEELFKIDSEEVVAVYSEYALMNLIVLQDQLGSVMRVISNIRPCIMVVIESEANHNSPVFVNRFVEALFYFSAYFDCVDACMEQDDPNRMIMESLFLGEGIRNIVATEGEDRDNRNVKIDVWRTFFAQFDMVEEELSESSLYQATLIIGKFACGRFCTLGMNEKSLIFGWKGTPILSLSSWKFVC